ncbi:Intradiol ring-cleavage dioxygenase [Desarmillaria tabescens]|uniref:Intradiol ring-cleavage dioxygenase n=1 Tax=Armillaria tabescens TaxID=1929756 RepID=A0AA39MK17_ARMTA|nr:Intradiol ring-cleavage dioxygenase [Desarmillaria tabescens]KAK0437761.1 Intradiol ring-cleavage dioxygenase [Desarmillaria tabescens]
MILLPSSFFFLFFALLPAALAHSNPKTDAEIEVQRSLQQAAYHCAPAVAQFTAQRKRAWAQKVLAGNPSLPAYQDLFTSYNDAIDGEKAVPGEEGQELMSCTPVTEEAKMENNSCVLTPIVTEGPYYHLVGHPIRQNIAEYQAGLLLLLDIGVIDVETCQPLPNVLIDIWQANATGHYAGHPTPKPELVNEKPQVGGKRSGLLSAFPRTNDHETFLRGAWPTNENGVAQFTTIFPGYYTGRATHVHTKVFQSWTTLPNGTFEGGKLSHVGQFFFDDEVNLQVDKMHPYTTNPIKDTIGRTRNWRDSLNIFEDSQGPEGKYDPVFKLHLLGGVINQGLAGFITMGINTSVEVDNWWKG